jgi:enoyl-CoA hydratase/carnithine racemase
LSIDTADPADLGRCGLRLDIDDSSPAGSVATVTLSRPERRNAMTPATWHGLAAIGAGLPDRVRIVIVRGAGPSFSAGIDLRMFSADGVPGEERLPPPGDPGFEQWIADCQAGYIWLRDSRIVSVAAVQGHAIGAGCQLALSCDLRVLADDAQLSVKEPVLGLVPDLTGTKPLVDLVGLPRALELCLTGRNVGAQEARELRLAELVVPAAELDAAVADLAAGLLATGAAAARATKELLAQALGHTATSRPPRSAGPRSCCSGPGPAPDGGHGGRFALS